MDYKQLRYNLTDAIATKTPSAALSEIKQQLYSFQVSHCAHPKTIFVTSPDTGKPYPLEVPCGKCYHCIETKQNEWVTRMWHETSAHKYCFFVTLTYERYLNFEDIPVRLLDAYWHQDHLNYNHKFCWSPCLCKLEHFQYFLRNLRNDLQASGRDRKLVYFMAQEYGHLYGAPHFHALIWTDNLLTNEDIEKAWSIRKGRKVMTYQPIGRFELDNLSTNGTIVKNHEIKIDGQLYSPKNAFMYVAKYVTKQEKYNSRRLMFFVEHMKQNLDFKYLNYRILSYYIPNFKKYAAKHQNEELFAHDVQKRVQDLLFPVTKGIRVLTAKDFDKFLMPFRPSTTCSRAAGIGSVYVNTNIASLVQGRLAINDPDLGSLVFPSFYFRKIKETFNPFEFRSRTSNSNSFSKGLRPKILSDLSRLAANDPFDSDCNRIRQDYTLPYDALKVQDWLRDSSKCFRLADTGERGLFVTREQELTEYVYVHLYKYERALNLYRLSRVMPLFEFVELFEFHCDRSLQKAQEQIQKCWDSWKDRLYIQEQLSDTLQALGFPSIEELRIEQVNYQDFQRSDANHRKQTNKLEFNETEKI